jgi:peroxiredoxin
MKNYLIICLSLFLIHSIKAQEINFKGDSIKINKEKILSGLKMAGFEDIDQSQPLMLDGITIPVYSVDFILLKGEDFMKAMMSGDFIPEPYIDSNKVVKLFLLRKATEQEKSQMIQFDDSAPNNEKVIGKPAMQFSATDLSGNIFSLDKLRGKLIVINFWFVECKPCITEIPDLNKLVEKYKNKNVVFLGIAVSSKTKVQKFLQTTPYKYNIISDAQNITSMYNVQSFPTHMIIDQKSIISYSSTGLSKSTISDLNKKIKKLLK